MHSIEKLTPGQRKGIIAAYTKPAAKPGIIVERIRKLGVSVSLATTYLFSRGYISYDDKLHLDRFS